MAGLDKLDIVVLGRLLDITDAFAAGVELHLGKSVAVLQGPIQQCCKAALDLMHTSNVAKLSGKCFFVEELKLILHLIFLSIFFNFSQPLYNEKNGFMHLFHRNALIRLCLLEVHLQK